MFVDTFVSLSYLLELIVEQSRKSLGVLWGFFGYTYVKEDSVSLDHCKRFPVVAPSTYLLVENFLVFNGYCCCWLISGDFTAPYLLRADNYLSPLKVPVVIAYYQ
ncbi:hypothetical protein GRJ2_001550800 [Grus japonensis]|uniref:Uncharacterized protein n=1 Tax=Grus japonensis TaxID=30415 RepID=A0ABC9WZI6_GRUJA